MKTLVVLAVSIVMVSIFFCPMVMAAPSMPADLQMVQPDPSLPKELAAFWGKWQSIPYPENFFVIVEKIDEEKASLYVWAPGLEGTAPSWGRREAKVIKERGKYKLWFRGPFGNVEVILKGEYLVTVSSAVGSQLKRVP
jgi:hypothetical protein